MEDDNTPDAETCDRLCHEFATITGTDTACGHFFLQDCQWNLQVAIERFFQIDNNTVAGSSSSTVVVKTDVSTKTSSVRDQLRLISWNVDGLDDKNRVSRTKAVCSVIKREMPSVVYLQEVVDETFKVYEKELSDNFTLIPASDDLKDYFTAILLQKKNVKCQSFKVIPFPTTQMLRSVLYVEAEIFGKPFVLMTSHLESTKPYAEERMKQLKMCLDLMKNVPPNKTVLFGGDLNLRDSEISSMEQDFPRNIVDAWIYRGSNSDVKFTWDCTKNDNIQMTGKFKPRCRFDRIYIKRSTPPTFDLVDFRFVGQERIRSCLCFPSDHWGICCDFTA